MNQQVTRPHLNEPYALFYDTRNKLWLQFNRCRHIYEIHSHKDILICISEIESYLHSNPDAYAAGYLTYESATAFDPSYKIKNNPNHQKPLLWFGIFDTPSAVILPATDTIPSLGTPLQWTPDISDQNYKHAIAQIKELIASGDTYQVNYTYRMQTEFAHTPFDYFCSIATPAPPPYAAYIQTTNNTICSFSPELFFELNGDNIQCRPMKGTHQRGRTLSEDMAFAKKLHLSEKDRAENVMIVDMIRNDLGRIAEISSVQVNHLYTIEKFPTVLQMTSAVSAQTKASIRNIFKSLFPCSSITGAPKTRTMEIISDLESSPRGIYTGAIGYFTGNRKALFNVAIRTIDIDTSTNRAEYGVGSGIVWDSQTDTEFKECVDKMRIVTEPPQSFSLIETMLWTPENSFFLLDLHLDRIIQSAEYFGFETSKPVIDCYLQELATQCISQACKIRIELNRNGVISHTVEPFPAAPSKPALKAAFAPFPVDSSNRMLYHKTSSRKLYNDLRSSLSSDIDDIILYNERDEITETTIANIVVEIDTMLLTPSLDCGLLPGVFRQHLLQTKAIKEAIIKRTDLDKVTKIFRINSVRKWEQIKIVY
jgi:para-aminobenzoate synthetase/4-amino-4-deoxychorismate lyase